MRRRRTISATIRSVRGENYLKGADGQGHVAVSSILRESRNFGRLDNEDGAGEIQGPGVSEH